MLTHVNLGLPLIQLSGYLAGAIVKFIYVLHFELHVYYIMSAYYNREKIKKLLRDKMRPASGFSGTKLYSKWDLIRYSRV